MPNLASTGIARLRHCTCSLLIGACKGCRRRHNTVAACCAVGAGVCHVSVADVVAPLPAHGTNPVVAAVAGYVAQSRLDMGGGQQHVNSLRTCPCVNSPAGVVKCWGWSNLSNGF